MQQLSGAFRSLPKPFEAFTLHQGISTSSGGRCMRPDAPFLAHAAPLGLKPAALRDVLARALILQAEVRAPEIAVEVLLRLGDRLLCFQVYSDLRFSALSACSLQEVNYSELFDRLIFYIPARASLL